MLTCFLVLLHTRLCAFLHVDYRDLLPVFPRKILLMFLSVYLKFLPEFFSEKQPNKTFHRCDLLCFFPKVNLVFILRVGNTFLLHVSLNGKNIVVFSWRSNSLFSSYKIQNYCRRNPSRHTDTPTYMEWKHDHVMIQSAMLSRLCCQDKNSTRYSDLL